MTISKEERETLKRKIDFIRVRNNALEAFMSSNHPNPNDPGNSVLIRQFGEKSMHDKVKDWETMMSMLAQQFSDIQELIGMVSDL